MPFQQHRVGPLPGTEGGRPRTSLIHGYSCGRFFK